MLRILTRHTSDVTYFTDDRAAELEGVRDGGAGWWLRGVGDTNDPRVVARVLATTERSRVHGYDLVIAAPRPISILVALDPANASEVVAAHRESVRATVEYLEDRALVVRDRRGGEQRDDRGRWESVVSFTHGINRHAEPHLHDHVLVGARASDARSVLDARSLFVHARAADALYRSSLRSELASRTTWASWRSFSGVEHVEGLDEGYRALWGGHFDNRGEKLAWSRERVLDRWAHDLDRFVPQGPVVAPGGDRRRLDEHAFAGSFEGRLGVSRREVVEAWANAARYGQHARSVNRAVDELYPMLASSRGVRAPSIGVREARMTGLVRTNGARPLDERALVDWRQRTRERSAGPDRSERSR